MTDRVPVSEPPHRRPVEVPPLRITEFSYERKQWPHPGEWDPGHIRRVFAEMAEHFPPELRDGDRFLPPSPTQIMDAVDRSATDLQVALEQYLTGLAPGRVWSSAKMRGLYDAFMERSLTSEDFAAVAAYAIKEHSA